MNIWIRLSLMLVALVAWTAAGAVLAALRHRTRQYEHFDWGLTAVAGSLMGVGALCSAAASGLMAIFAFGGVCIWSSYVVAAQRLGLFRLQSPRPEETAMEKPRPRA